MKQILRAVDMGLTDRVMKDVIPCLTSDAQTFSQQVTMRVAHRAVGRAWLKTMTLVLPAWAFQDKVNYCGKGLVDGGKDFVTYYLAHELSHIAMNTTRHNKDFMECFMKFCPMELQWYETIYKPRNAEAAGIEE